MQVISVKYMVLDFGFHRVFDNDIAHRYVYGCAKNTFVPLSEKNIIIMIYDKIDFSFKM